MELKWKYLDEFYREKYFDKDVPQVYLKSEADREIARQKRKRRLALAHFCWERRWRPEFDKYAFWHRWGKIWFELADKFKEAK